MLGYPLNHIDIICRIWTLKRTMHNALIFIIKESRVETTFFMFYVHVCECDLAMGHGWRTIDGDDDDDDNDDLGKGSIFRKNINWITNHE